MMTAAPQKQSISLGQLLPEVALPASVADCRLQGLQLDSRAVSEGDLFIAQCGATVDARQFIPAAIAQGAVGVVAESESDRESIAYQDSAPVISLPALQDRVSAMAARFYAQPSQQMRVIGVTGTNGKTTCSQWLAQLQVLLGNKAGVMGTLGYGLPQNEGGEQASLTETGYTTPDAVETQKLLAQMREQGAEMVAMEVSSHSLCQGRVAAVTFETALFTNLSRDHLDYHGTMDDYAEAKQRLFALPGLQQAVINIDDAWGAAMCAAVPGAVQLIRYSLQDSSAEVFARDIRYSASGVTAEVVTPWGSGKLRCALLGDFNLSNLLGVIAASVAGSELPESTFEQLLSLLPQLLPVAGRMQPVLEASDIHVVVDYAHTPDALEKTLQALRSHCEGQLWCLFGCGGDRDSGKRAEMGAVAERFADRVVVTSDNPRTESPQQIIDDILTGIADESRCAVDVNRERAIHAAIAKAAPGDTLLLAGKGHENYQIIGTEKHAFCDFESARQALRVRECGEGQR